MMSGVATIIFLLIVRNRVPSYLGTSASFVGAVAAIRAGGGDNAAVTGAILIAGVILALVGVLVKVLGAGFVNKIFPPAVTGAVVMLIGFNLAGVATNVYWHQDQWVAFVTLLATLIMSVVFRGFLARITVFLGLIVGTIVAMLFDAIGINGYDRFDAATGKVLDPATARVNWDGFKNADLFGLPNFHGPSFSGSYILIVLPAVIALIAENTGHVKAVAQMTGTNLDDVLGDAIIGDGVGTKIGRAHV